ncbi:CASP-like protein [Musa troglodytarum]|uniref:CASP-like protein n=1 Tax=Musa troglodytarum TaxID=320322 RepID=A0A9E7F3D0_9LILI|nr:CASP-like protein [Musa troglodytarum]
MKVAVGSPGTWSGLLLRVGQCAFAGASIGVMLSAFGFSSYTAFCYLIASMALQILWSFGLLCLDLHALKFKRDLHNPLLVSLFVVGDWVSSFDAGNSYTHTCSRVLFCWCGCSVREGCAFLQKASSTLVWHVPNLHCNGLHHLVVGCQIFRGNVLDPGIWLTKTVYAFLGD